MGHTRATGPFFVYHQMTQPDQSSRRRSLQLWNTRTRTKEEFRAGPIVRVYVCGITPYATTHLGHARTYLVYDVLIREIERLGHAVRYAQNVTDVDDPLFERAQKLGISTAELSGQSTRMFQDDLAALRIRPPDYYPRASDEIPEMLDMIGRLVEAGSAYLSGDRVYFRIRSRPDYGSLSRLTREEMIAVARDRGEDPSDPRKEDPLDFVLWKPSQPGETSWPGPWGTGRPGWHIECSAMSLHYLGPEIDIHGGGTDLIYPHHESEIAQTETATGHAPLARYWMHCEMVRLDGVKMSKSLGNMVFARELRKRVSPVAIRHYLLTRHYRELFDYTDEGLAASVERVSRVDRALAVCGVRDEALDLATWENRFDAALSDDLNTPLALNALDAAANAVLAAPAGDSAREGSAALRRMAVRLGLSEG
jgi:L-cysteine:1D-myo-inositol 2-amino-2-deoxy-alpha-D-glucopyranoside ligase